MVSVASIPYLIPAGFFLEDSALNLFGIKSRESLP
jgi:hypothetical protein